MIQYFCEDLGQPPEEAQCVVLLANTEMYRSDAMCMRIVNIVLAYLRQQPVNIPGGSI